ncbi:MAG: DUF2203 domain-containing protein [Planctomycetaceae bacterium]
MTTERLFTLDEANRHLPLVRSITRDAVRRYRAVKGEIQVLSRLKARLRGGEVVAVEEVHRRDGAIEQNLEELRRLVAELEQLGCRLRDYEKGVVDFPAATMDGDQFVFYCWMSGEPGVDHWHREEEGFEQRRLLGADTPA